MVADVSDLVYPIDLDPTVYVKLYDRGARTFAPNFEDGSQNGKYSQTNTPGRINRGIEITQTGGTLTIAASSNLTAIDASGDQFLGNNTTASQDWLEFGNSLKTNKVGAKAEFTTDAVTEIWAGLTYSPAGGIIKATIDKGTDFEIINYIDTYSETIQSEQKTLLASGLRNQAHTVELELTGKSNVKQSDSTYTVTQTSESVEDVFSTYLYEGNGGTQTIENNIDLE